MVILGIDPGTTRIGFGVIEKNRGTLACLDYGLITNPKLDNPLSRKDIINNLNRIIAIHKPDVAAIEKLFFFKNQKTAIPVSEMRGVVLATLALADIPIYEYTPLEVKKSVSSYGRAKKDQVQKMVRLILGLKEQIRPDDATDGLAIAICYANTILPTNY